MDYKEKLEEAKRLYESANDEQKHIIENLFPELKESEDEKIKEDLIQWISDFPDMIWSGHYKKDVIAWLEKQGEQKSSNIVPIPYGCHAYIKDRKVYIENYTKTTPADKVEPKFHKGDWIVSPDNLVCKITQANSHSYTLHLYNDDYRIFDTESWHIDKKYHLWTIQDAKEGDVLATDKSVFIYAKVLYNKPYAYCGVDKFGVFKDNCLEYDWTNSVDNIHPATKEQRDTLFTKMKESGYEFDFETKELKKIENKKVVFKKDEKSTAWSKDDDYNVQCLIAKVTYDIQKGNIGRNQELIDWLKSLKYRINND